MREMVLIDGCDYRIGTDDSLGFPADGEGPSRAVEVSPFYISKTSVTNAEFEVFVEATRYRTDAERFGWSFVFHSHVPKVLLKRGKARTVAGLGWWLAVDGASWKKPEGPGSTHRSRLDYPAVHITWNDAMAYCQWAGQRLPTEAEWEVAARGGSEGKTYVWGNEFAPNGSFRCNTWQGDFPDTDTGDDGYAGTCPAKAFAPNGYGLYNMAGNVWEWCLDWFSPRYHKTSSDTDPMGPAVGTAKTMKGGSFLCHVSYCNRYRVAARTSNTPDSSTANLGFRTVRDVA